jgi:hypothetical protein
MVIIIKIKLMAKDDKSIAAATRYKGTASQELDPIKLAKNVMTSEELLHYESWSNGIELPTINWNMGRDPLPEDKLVKKRFSSQPQAMARIWQQEKADMYHSV